MNFNFYERFYLYCIIIFVLSTKFIMIADFGQVFEFLLKYYEILWGFLVINMHKKPMGFNYCWAGLGWAS